MHAVKERNVGKCKFCGKSIYWIRSEPNNKPTPLEIQHRTIFDKFGIVHSGHEAHFPNCDPYQKMLKEKKKS